MKNLRIIMLVIMSLCIKPLFALGGSEKAKIADVLRDVSEKQQQTYEEKQRKLQEAEEARKQQEEVARKQEEARKETQKKIDELKVQEEKAQKEREAAEVKAVKDNFEKHLNDLLAQKDNVKEYLNNLAQLIEIYERKFATHSDMLRKTLQEKLKTEPPLKRLKTLMNIVIDVGEIASTEASQDLIKQMLISVNDKDLAGALKANPKEFNDTMHDFAVHIAVIEVDNPLFEAIKQFSEHVIAATTNPDLLFFWFNTIPFEKHKNDLMDLIKKIDFTKLPDNVHPEIYRRWVDFFKKNLKTAPPAQLVSKYLESLVSSDSLAELSKEVEFLKSDITQDFLEKNNKLMKGFIKKYVELLKTGGTFHDYRLAIETFGKGMDFADLIDVQFGLLGKLEEHPDWLTKISGSNDRVKLENDQKFLADMMQEMTDKQTPKSATALFNLIKTVKSVIDDSVGDQKERLTILSDKLADDIVPNLAWTQRWSGKISSFFDTYLPWWGKNRTYKPHWISWPQEKRLMIYGLTKDESEHEQQLSYVKKDDKDRYRSEYYPGPEYGSYYKKRFLSHESGEKALNRLLEIRDLYPKERYGDVQQALENDAREIFGRIFEYDKILNFIKNDIKKQELFFSFKKAPSLGSYYQTVGRYGEKHVGEYERSADVLISDFHSGLEDGTLLFDKISDDVFSRIIDTYLIDISKKAGLMSDHQFAMFISELGKNRVDNADYIDSGVNDLVTAYRNLSKERQPLFSKTAIQYLNNSAKTVGKDRAQQAIKSFKEQAARPA